jgi:hypothetical protein
MLIANCCVIPQIIKVPRPSVLNFRRFRVCHLTDLIGQRFSSAIAIKTSNGLNALRLICVMLRDAAFLMYGKTRRFVPEPTGGKR